MTLMATAAQQEIDNQIEVTLRVIGAVAIGAACFGWGMQFCTILGGFLAMTGGAYFVVGVFQKLAGDRRR